MVKTFKRGELVFIKGENKKGAFISNNRDGKTATVEFITSFNRETGERTTKLERVDVSKLTPYRKPKPKKYNPNEMYWMVGEFHSAFGHDVATSPTPMSEEVAVNRAVWEAEELVELLYATTGGDKERFTQLYADLLTGIDKAYQKQIKNGSPIEDILTAQVDALTDALYFNQGSFNVIGVEPFNFFKIVQQANMGKLWEDGLPRYRDEDGKIMKPPHWEDRCAPEGRIKKELERQIERKTTTK